MRKNVLVICSFVMPFFFFNPAVIYYVNPHFGEIRIWFALSILGSISVLLVALISIMIRRLPAIAGKVAIVFVLSIAVATYVQAQVLSPMLELDMTGKSIDWASLGTWPLIESLILLMILIISSLLSWRLHHARHWIAGSILVAAAVSATSEALDGSTIHVVSDQPSERQDDESVFEFSSTTNIIHLMPDAVQSDIAASILRKNKELAQAFAGFTLFEAHLGGFHSTAPTLPSLFIGDLYDLSHGYQARNVRKAFAERSYVNHLTDAGYIIDFAAASPLVCTGPGARCVHLPFGDFRSRGYTTGPSAGLVDLGLLVDLSLFRQSPALLKELIYDKGEWMISNLAVETSANYFSHAPVLSEWQLKGTVADATPRYKWYHWIGAHAPQMWDSDCTFIGNQPWEKDSVFAQTECVLKKISLFLDWLREMDILDQSLIIISSDHGTNQPPGDMRNYFHTELFRLGEVGTARPLLMVKPLNQSKALEFSFSPTSIIDIAPTIMEQIELVHEYSGFDIFSISPEKSRTRSYHKYARPPFRWGPESVPLNRWLVTGNPNDWNNWIPQSFHVDRVAPEEIRNLTGDEAADFVWGTIPGSGHEPDDAYILGRDLVLAMRPGWSDDLILELEMKIPDLNSSSGQQVELSVNGEKTGRVLQLDADASGQWYRLQFCIKDDSVFDGQDNFFHLRMSDVFELGGREDRWISAAVRSARFAEKADCVERINGIED